MPQNEGLLFFSSKCGNKNKIRNKYSNKFDGEAESFHESLYPTWEIMLLVFSVDGNVILF